MLKVFGINNKDIFPVCVMATMSSGKSTFVNAILGEEILPEKNEACTARALAVINNDVADTPKAFIVKTDGTKGYVEIDSQSVMEKINADESVKNVLVEMNVPAIHNIHKTLVIIDTPGVNNSEDIRHGERTKAILDIMDEGVIIYLLNATQLATNDDALLLQMVSQHIMKHPNLKICFVLNKIDMLDEDKESIASTIDTARKYICDYGIDNPMIYPLSALSAKVLRLKLNDKYMTKSERRYLTDAYKEYKANEKNMLQYASIYNQLDKQYIIGDVTVSEYELKRAIENTGITGIEKQIVDFIIAAENRSISQTFDTKDYAEWEGVYSKKRRAKNIVNYAGEIKWICKPCRQVNGDNSECLNCGQPNVKWHKTEE